MKAKNKDIKRGTLINSMKERGLMSTRDHVAVAGAEDREIITILILLITETIVVMLATTTTITTITITLMMPRHVDVADLDLVSNSNVTILGKIKMNLTLKENLGKKVKITKKRSSNKNNNSKI